MHMRIRIRMCIRRYMGICVNMRINMCIDMYVYSHVRSEEN